MPLCCGGLLRPPLTRGRLRPPPVAEKGSKKEWPPHGDWRARQRDDRTDVATGELSSVSETEGEMSRRSIFKAVLTFSLPPSKPAILPPPSSEGGLNALTLWGLS